MFERHRFLAAATLIVLCATLLHWGTVDEGLFLDDVAIYGGLGLARDGVAGARWWDVYFLGGYDERLRFSGALPWWVAEEVQLHFFRPAAAATHYLDVLLWPDSPRAMHLHNLGWFALTGGAAAWLYGHVLESRREAVLALAVFMFAYVHEWPVQWLAARNSQMALVFGALSILGFRRWGEGWRWRALAGAGLGLSLLSSELGVCVLAFVIGFGMLEGRSGGGRRWSVVGVAVGMIVVWRIGYVLGGYGAVGSGTYIDPLSAPVAFLRVAPERALLQALSLVGPPELLLHPAVSLAVRSLFWGVGLVGLALVGRMLRDKDLWPWAIAATLSLVPLISSVPQPRLLGFVLLGVAPLAARALVSGWSTRRWGRVGAAFVATHQLLLGPLVTTGALDGLRPSEISAFGEPGTELGDLEGRNLLLLNQSTYATAKMLAAVRTERGLSMPAFAWALGVGDDISMTREGCCTVVLTSPSGLFQERWAAMYRGPQVPFRKGDVVKTLSFEARVRDVTSWGYAKEVAFVMTGPLRSPQFVFARWNGRDYEAVSPREIPKR